ncbi:hypothetical protein SAMN05192529_11490 [Arachidicoccus rhizosphaerae]|uniref:Uncharacterized protein n=1 Tax=Arachidicoccus rhizosphaerae TaxID=551991 RepID=A0A1H4AF82_9BACT|nr:hypothetical protein SAMN05192529_11490 [Arachidicoccus rhizosphaerae]
MNNQPLIKTLNGLLQSDLLPVPGRGSAKRKMPVHGATDLSTTIKESGQLLKTGSNVPVFIQKRQLSDLSLLF